MAPTAERSVSRSPSMDPPYQAPVTELKHVIDAIMDLEQKNGCTTEQIFTKLKSIRKPSLKRAEDRYYERLKTEIRRELRNGINIGKLVKQYGKIHIREPEPSDKPKKTAKKVPKGKKKRDVSTSSSSDSDSKPTRCSKSKKRKNSVPDKKPDESSPVKDSQPTYNLLDSMSLDTLLSIPPKQFKQRVKRQNQQMDDEDIHNPQGSDDEKRSESVVLLQPKQSASGAFLDSD